MVQFIFWVTKILKKVSPSLLLSSVFTITLRMFRQIIQYRIAISGFCTEVQDMKLKGNIVSFYILYLYKHLNTINEIRTERSVVEFVFHFLFFVNGHLLETQIQTNKFCTLWLVKKTRLWGDWALNSCKFYFKRCRNDLVAVTVLRLRFPMFNSTGVRICI